MKKTLICLTMLCAQAAIGSPLQQSFSVRAETEYDDNPSMVATNPRGVWVTTVTPRYQARYVDGADEWTAAVRVDVARSSDQGLILDRQDPSLALGWSHAYPRGRVAVTANYEEESTSSSEATDATAAGTNDTRTQYTLGMEWNHAVTERTNAGLTATYEVNSYQGVGGEESGFSNYESVAVMASLERLLSERNSVYTRVGATEYMPDPPTSSSTHYVALVGFRSQLSPALSVDVNAGASQVDSDIDETGWNGALTANYTGERVRSSLALSRVTTASGSGGFTDMDQLTAGVSYQIDERTTAGVEVGLEESYSETPSTASSVTLQVGREIYQDLTIAAAYEYRQQEMDDEKADGSAWTLSLSYDIPDI